MQQVTLTPQLTPARFERFVGRLVVTPRLAATYAGDVLEVTFGKVLGCQTARGWKIVHDRRDQVVIGMRVLAQAHDRDTGRPQCLDVRIGRQARGQRAANAHTGRVIAVEGAQADQLPAAIACSVNHRGPDRVVLRAQIQGNRRPVTPPAGELLDLSCVINHVNELNPRWSQGQDSERSGIRPNQPERNVVRVAAFSDHEHAAQQSNAPKQQSRAFL